MPPMQISRGYGPQQNVAELLELDVLFEVLFVLTSRLNLAAGVVIAAEADAEAIEDTAIVAVAREES